MRKIKPNGYYKDFENVKREIQPLIKELGHFPVSKEIKKGRLSTLLNYVAKYHGGLSKVRQKMGYRVNKRPPRHWIDFENIMSELEPIIKRLRHFPTQVELRKMDKSGLAFAMHKYHGGITKVREKLGYEPKIKPSGYWCDYRNIKKDLEKVIEKIGHFPSYGELSGIGLFSLAGAISQHGGFFIVAEKMGHRVMRKPINYWKKWGNIKRELESLIKRLGHFPTHEELVENGESSIMAAVVNYFGGVNEVRKKLGYEINKKPNSYYKDFENVKREIQPLIKELGHFPTQKELCKMGRSGLMSGIGKYHGGLNKVRIFLSYPTHNVKDKIRTEKSLVDLLNNDEKARRVVERFGGDIGDVADILAVVYEGRLSREDAANLVAKPSIRAYLGRFKRPIGGIGELAEISNELLPHDKNEVIKGILYRKVSEYIYQKCGPYPSREKRKALLDEFEGELSKVGGNGNV